MEVPYGRTQGYYVVGAKRPVSFMNDYDFPQIKGKKEVKKIRNKKGDTVAKIYVVKDSEKSE